MEKRTATHTVHQLASLAGISVRTLHHYDHIGLLTPSARSAAGYRLYGTEDLLRLQQILLYRELDLPLEEIRRILDDPGFDPVRGAGAAPADAGAAMPNGWRVSCIRSTERSPD